MRLPVGCQIIADDGETVLVDPTKEGQEIVLAEELRKGAFSNHLPIKPAHAQLGEKGSEMWVWLRLN